DGARKRRRSSCRGMADSSRRRGGAERASIRRGEGPLEHSRDPPPAAALSRDEPAGGASGGGGPSNTPGARRRLLRYPAPSPLALPLAAALRAEDAITSVKDALNLFDFEEAARRVVPPRPRGDLANG